MATTASQGDDQAPVPLGELLRTHTIKARGPGDPTFIPLKLLLSILTKERLKREFNLPRYYKKKKRRWSAERIEELVNIIRPHHDGVKPDSAEDKKGYIRVFALLLKLDMVLRIEHFIDNEESDHIFPVENPEPNGNLRKSGIDKAELKATARWSQRDREDLFRRQWEMRPAFFDFADIDKTYNFASGIVLPWVKGEGTPTETAMGNPSEREGAYGIVTQVEIDPRSHSFETVLREVGLSERKFFGLKTLHKGVPEVNGFQNELEQLRRFSGKVHPHLITLLASFEQDGVSHFIFPWAECNLETYWEKIQPWGDDTPSTRLDLDCARWVANQLVGITGAIHSIHQRRENNLKPGVEGFGRHSDLKPDNVLWFRYENDPKGILVVTDLGLATFNRELSRSIQPGSSARVPGYRAPECDIHDAKARRKTDIWTLGCIFLEFVTWLLGGNQLLGDFKQQRKSLDHLNNAKSNLFFEFEEQHNQDSGGDKKRTGHMQVKRAVAKFIANLHGLPNCSQFVHNVLDIIQDRMMLVDQEKRSDASVLLKEFKDLSKAKTPGFFTEGLPVAMPVREQPGLKAELEGPVQPGKTPAGEKAVITTTTVEDSNDGAPGEESKLGSSVQPSNIPASDKPPIKTTIEGDSKDGAPRAEIPTVIIDDSNVQPYGEVRGWREGW